MSSQRDERRRALRRRRQGDSRWIQGITVWSTVLALAGIGLVHRDLAPPEEIAWRSVEVAGIPAQRAGDLVLQHHEGDDVWASYGYSVYRSRSGEPFRRVATVRPPTGEYLGGYSRTLRSLLGYQEIAEVVPLRDDLVLVFAAGEIHRVDLSTGTEETVHRMRYFGRGIGRGVMPAGIAVDDRGSVYYGEYPTRKMGPRESVRVWRSDDEGRTWDVAYEFAPGRVRHVHTVAWDPYAGALWVGTGDRDSECRLGLSRDRGASFEWIGHGSQTFRAVSLMFGPEDVSWVMDSTRVPSRVVRYQRTSGEIQLSASHFDDPGYYSRMIGPGRGLATLGEGSASVWVLEADRAPHKVVEWDVAESSGGPNPVVRLARGNDPARDWVYLNPLRTRAEGAAIYRVPNTWGGGLELASK